MEITISGNDKNLLRQVEDYAKKLGLSISRKVQAGPKEERSSDKLYELMSAKAKKGGIKSIKDPIAWQREQRKDKPLYGRD